MKTFEFVSRPSLHLDVKYSNMSLHCIIYITFKMKNLKWINTYLGIFCSSCSHFLHHVVHDSKETISFPQAQPDLFGFTFKTRTIENCIRHNLPKITIMNLEKRISPEKKNKKLLLASLNETFKFTTNNILTKDY